MKKIAVGLVCVGLLMSFGCSNPKGQRLTEKNKEAFLKDDVSPKTLTEAFLAEIEGFKSLPKEDADLLTRYVARHTLREKLRGDAEKTVPLVGKTVGEILELQKQWDKEQKEEAEMATKIAEEEQAKEEALQAELRNSLRLTVYKKGFIPSDAMSSRYDDYVTFSVTYENLSQKDIRAFQGTVVFNDLFGDAVKRVSIKITDPIKAGGKATWSGVMKYNQFIDSDERLKNTDFKDLKVVWAPEKIIFSDGTTLPKEKDTQ